MVIKDNTQYFEFNITGYEFSEINDMWDDWYRMYFLIKQNEQKLAEETDCCVLTFEALIIIENLNKLLKGEVSVCESDFTEPYFKILIRKQNEGYYVKLTFQAFRISTKDLKDINVETNITHAQLTEFIKEFEEQIKEYPKRECIKEVPVIKDETITERLLCLLNKKYNRTFLATDSCITICKNESVTLWINNIKTNKEEYVEARLFFADEEVTYNSFDFVNEDQFVNEIFKGVYNIAGKQIKIVAISVKHKYFGKSYYEKKENDWLLYDKYIIKNRLVNIFNFKNYVKEREYKFEL